MRIRGCKDYNACRDGRGSNAYRAHIGTDGLGAVRPVTTITPVGAIGAERD